VEDIRRGGYRYRYIAFVLKTTNSFCSISRNTLFTEIKNQCQMLFQKKWREMGIRLISFNGVTGIIRCYHIEKNQTITLLENITSVTSHKVQIETIGASGTIRKLISKYLS
jgi:RNase P/RNase MRP subunit POP5